MSVEVFNEVFSLRPRPLIESLLMIVDEENFNNNSNFAIILSAPTGYGKSSCTIALAKFIAKEGNIAERLIHVLPLRAIVSDLYIKAYSKLNDLSIGAQAMHLLDANKTPFFMPMLVYTTFDSFIHNLFRVPIAERDITRSHFDAPRYSIYTSMVVFDEAHLFSSESPLSKKEEFIKSEFRMFTAFSAALESLSISLTPIIIMSATMPSKFLYSIIENIKDPHYTLGKKLYVIKYNPELDDGKANVEKVDYKNKTFLKVEVGDQKFLEEAKKLNPNFNGIIKQEDVCKKTIDELRNGAKVLIVRNTVKDAIETFKTIKNKGEDAVLIHGKLSIGDKLKALNYIEHKLKTGKAFALVATQVIEAGVDLDLDILITDIAPLNSLIQRIGRVGRRIETKRVVDPAVYVIEGDGSQVYDEDLTKKTLNLLREVKEKKYKIMWRVPEIKNTEKCLGYIEALDIVYADWNYNIDENLRKAFLDIDRYYMLSQNHIKRFLDDICNFVREEGIFQVSYLPDNYLKHYEDLRNESDDIWNIVYKSLIPISVRTLAKEWKNILSIEDGKIKILTISKDERIELSYSKAFYEALEEISSSYHIKCRFLKKLEGILNNEFRKYGSIAIAPVLKSGVYIEGEGLKID